MIRVLFVCLGNICRSPMAEAIFRSRIEEEGLEGKIEVDSAGVGHWHIGSPPHQGTRDILEKKRIAATGMTARQIEAADWEEFHYIIAMDDKNISDLHTIRMKEGVVVQKLMDYVPAPVQQEVPDPYFTGDFEETYELVREGCEHLLESIKRNQAM
ncbi:low molecular weight protein-tyrosine-phosphatase [Salimicrobium sp. PL1-032A]|uniref:low molecular weight protein-tyrosine-phosphatase n=1 Tax=Salimicrobium sp. PL1-032A TaxID=3095364 RepID=UPI00326077D7